MNATNLTHENVTSIVNELSIYMDANMLQAFIRVLDMVAGGDAAAIADLTARVAALESPGV